MSAGLVLVIGLVVTAAILGSPDEDTGLTKSLGRRSPSNLEAASPTNNDSGGQTKFTIDHVPRDVTRLTVSTTTDLPACAIAHPRVGCVLPGSSCLTVARGAEGAAASAAGAGAGVG